MFRIFQTKMRIKAVKKYVENPKKSQKLIWLQLQLQFGNLVPILLYGNHFSIL